jgi:hypothetical protein
MALHNVDELHGFQRSERPQEPNSWAIITSFTGDGSIRSFAECLKVELALKDVQQLQQQTQQPSSPPGGHHYSHHPTSGNGKYASSAGLYMLHYLHLRKTTRNRSHI